MYLVIVILQAWGSCNKGNIIYSRHSLVVHYVHYSNLNILHRRLLRVIWTSNHSWKGKCLIIFYSCFK